MLTSHCRSRHFFKPNFRGRSTLVYGFAGAVGPRPGPIPTRGTAPLQPCRTRMWMARLPRGTLPQLGIVRAVGACSHYCCSVLRMTAAPVFSREEALAICREKTFRRGFDGLTWIRNRSRFARRYFARMRGCARRMAPTRTCFGCPKLGKKLVYSCRWR